MQKYGNIHLLLDTHVFVWLMNGDESLSPKARSYIENIVKDGGEIAISAMSLWEVGMLHFRKRILLNQPCLNWITHSLKTPGMYLAELTAEISVDSCALPNTFHGDPADRIIVATARILEVPLMTRDKKILAYAEEGFVRCVTS